MTTANDATSEKNHTSAGGEYFLLRGVRSGLDTILTTTVAIRCLKEDKSGDY